MQCKHFEKEEREKGGGRDIASHLDLLWKLKQLVLTAFAFAVTIIMMHYYFQKQLRQLAIHYFSFTLVSTSRFVNPFFTEVEDAKH